MNFIRTALASFFAILIYTLPFYSSIYIKTGLVITLISLCFLDILRKKSLRLIWQESFMFLFFIMVITRYSLSGLYTQSQLSTIIFNYITPFFMLFTVRRLWKAKFDWLVLGYAYLAGCITATIILVYKWIVEGAATRLSIGELNANYVSYCLVTGVVVGLTLILLSKNKFQIRALVATLAILFVGILLGGTRGSLISILGLLIGFSFFRFRRNPFKITILSIAAISFGIFLFNIIPEAVSSRILSDSSTGDVTSGRSYLWSLAVSYISESPLTGYGIGYFKYNNASGIEVHNVFLSILVEFGIVGLLFYVPVLFSIIFIKHKSLEVMQARIFFITSWLPIAMTGVWEYSIAAWFVFAWLIYVPPELHDNPVRKKNYN